MKTEITNDTGLIAEELMLGRVAGVPTETVYGLGANALNEQAVAQIYDIKERPRFNPVIVHVASANEFQLYAEDIDERVYELSREFSPGPVTFVVRKKPLIPDIVTAGNDSVGLRIPDHKLLQEVILKCGFPVAAPSANMFGRISPTSAEDCLKEIDGKVRFVLDGGRCRVGIESTVVSFLDKAPRILRHGAVSKEEIEDVIGAVKEAGKERILSPGMLASHYAPAKPLYICDKLPDEDKLHEMNAGVLDLERFGTLRNAAVNLFSELRKLDEAESDMILCARVADEGIGRAINDRLERASSGKISFAKGITEISELKNA